MTRHYLFFIAQNYSFEILRPLQTIIQARGDKVLWFIYGNEVSLCNFHHDEKYTSDPKQAVSFNPLATFVPGNMVPNFIPGLKVQVFHGLEWKKKGHFVIRGCFDLYCTHGPATTSRFNELAQQYGYFNVIETGWPKLDPLFDSPSYQWPAKTNQPIILFAPTFSPNLTCAPTLLAEITRLVNERDWQWVVKFHPKMNPEWIAQYQKVIGNNYHISDEYSVASLLQSADVLLSDTSSIIGEFSLLSKPVVSFNNSQPGDYLIDISLTDKLESSIEAALSPNSSLLGHINHYAQDLHPYIDGQSAQRVLAATDTLIQNKRKCLKQKPLNLFRNLKMRKKLSYWTL
jgi:CDP-glycerol glycerophosphotransferase (TagB/SpsB family)